MEKIFLLIDSMNEEVLGLLGIKLEKREEYAIEYIEEMLAAYAAATDLDFSKFVSGIGHRKGIHQKQYQQMQGYLVRLKSYASHFEICGEMRNSYSKTNHDATFMRVKCDYMGNDQLLPAYNMQIAICDEYIAVIDAKSYASDMECFVPLMEKFKETKYAKYHNNPYRVDNFCRDASGNLICPNNKKFIFKYNKHVYKNKYGRTEEIYECEDCSECSYRSECCMKSVGN